MDIYAVNDIAKLIEGNSYVGRGIVIGKSADGTKACTAYFIMGRSANSRNRIFTERGGVLYTEPFDASKVEDPSLIIYAAVRNYENKIIVTNGDQTDTINDALKSGGSFKSALETREFEPDAPNFTPRISGMLTFENKDFTYEMSILKSADAAGSACNRYTFSYSPQVSVISSTPMSATATPFPPFRASRREWLSRTISTSSHSRFGTPLMRTTKSRSMSDTPIS